jgi:hypothetical protein
MTQAAMQGDDTLALGPVSRTIEADLRATVRKHGVVVWLDPLANYTVFVDGLAAARAQGSLPYAVHAFRGSHVALLLELEPMTRSAARPALVVHMPGFNEETIRSTPLLELYEAGVRYRKGLDGAVADAAAGRVRPEDVEAFRKRASTTLEDADAWLADALATGDDALVTKLRQHEPSTVLSGLLGRGPLAVEGQLRANLGTVFGHLATALGVPASWCDVVLPARAPNSTEDFASVEELAFAVASYCVCVEYVDDLGRVATAACLRVARTLPTATITAARSVAAFLRVQHPEFYERTADEMEELLGEERTSGAAAELGKVDSFRFEEARIFRAALDLLDQEQWSTAEAWAAQRLDPQSPHASFWVQRDPKRQAAWKLVRQAAMLGLALAAASMTLRAADGLASAVDDYRTKGAPVDRAHRQLEQLRAALLDAALPEFETLRSRLDGMGARWRTWADAWSKAFGAACRKHGFLPPPSLQQRTLFDDVVRPWTEQRGATAYFVVDALRFEMADELHRSIGSPPASVVLLSARLAELPTVTEVGMNVLAPVAVDGKLRPAVRDDAILGFDSGEFRVDGPDSRRRAMLLRANGRACPWLTLDEVEAEELVKLRRTVEQTQLLVVHSTEIDEAGESGAGLAVFDRMIARLRGAWQRLREAGVRRFVITSDHGFLLHDDRSGAVQPRGRPSDPKRRHLLTSVGADHPGELRVALADLGYLGTSAHAVFPETTAVFDTGRRVQRFVHGGNSLQERVVPVLTIEHRAAAGSSALEYAVRVEAAEPVANMECLRVTVESGAQIGLDFGGLKEVDLALRVPGDPRVDVEMCLVRGGRARLEGAVVRAPLGATFELFFRLHGLEEARVAVEVYHPGAAASVAPAGPPELFAVSALRRAQSVPPASSAPASTRTPRPEPELDWRARITHEGDRAVFAHLHAHGSISEVDVARLLGSPRAARAFALRVDSWAAVVPFEVTTETVNGTKRYVRQGTSE